MSLWRGFESKVCLLGWNYEEHRLSRSAFLMNSAINLLERSLGQNGSVVKRM